MKKITFTVTQIIFLQKVRENIGYSSDEFLDLLDEQEGTTTDVEFELSEEDIEDIMDSIQQHIEDDDLPIEDLPEEDLATANEILVLLGVLPEELETTEKIDQPDDDEVAENDQNEEQQPG